MTDFNTVFDLYAKGAVAESKKSNVAAVAEEKRQKEKAKEFSYEYQEP